MFKKVNFEVKECLGMFDVTIKHEDRADVTISLFTQKEVEEFVLSQMGNAFGWPSVSSVVGLTTHTAVEEVLSDEDMAFLGSLTGPVIEKPVLPTGNVGLVSVTPPSRRVVQEACIIDGTVNKGNGDKLVVGIMSPDGTTEDLFYYYSDELTINVANLVGMTKEEAIQYKVDKDIAYLRS